jgi:hypothetical protein
VRHCFYAACLHGCYAACLLACPPAVFFSGTYFVRHCFYAACLHCFYAAQISVEYLLKKGGMGE